MIAEDEDEEADDGDGGDEWKRLLQLQIVFLRKTTGVSCGSIRLRSKRLD